MSKNTVRTIEERKAHCKAKYELMEHMPSTRTLMSFEDWMESEYRWYLTLEQYNDENTPQRTKQDADNAYNLYKLGIEAYNDLLDDMYALLS